MARRAATVAFALLMFLASSPEPASSQSDGDPVTLGTYRVFRSEILGEDRVLQVRLPREYDASVLDYPVVYLFYSDWVELYYAEAVNTIAQLSANLMPQVILVGVPNTDRYRDLYPWPRADGWGGEADRFLRFVREELFPFIDSEYRTKDYRVMVGPQAAAVFGVYALLEAPQAFDGLIVNDPCRIDSEERSLCEALARFAASPEAAGHFFAVSHVERDERWPPTRLEALREELEESAVGDFRWRISTDPDWRLFLAPVHLRENLLALFQGYAFQLDRDIGGLSDVLSHYEGLSRRWGFAVDPPDLVLSQVSDRLTEAQRFPAALEVLDHLVAVHPSSVNGYWRLANLYRVTGDTANAIRYYRECLEREPDMPPALRWLERLGGGG
jgi:enterochelin esterase-like enzyme